MTQREAMQRALDFIDHCGHVVSLNAFAEALRSDAEGALNAALDLPDVQPVTAPYGWIVNGNLWLFTGEYAERDAKNEAEHCGGTAKAVALFYTPQPVIAPVQAITDEQIDAALKAACMHSTTESRKDMLRAINAALGIAK